MSCLFKCLIDPSNVMHDDIQEIFVKKRNYVKRRYYDSEDAHYEKLEVLQGDDVAEEVPFEVKANPLPSDVLFTLVVVANGLTDASLFCCPSNPLTSIIIAIPTVRKQFF